MSTLVDIFIPDLGADKDVDLIDVMVEIGETVEVEEESAPEEEKAPVATPVHEEAKKEVAQETVADAAAPMGLEAAEAELKAISEIGAEISCQFVNEQTICSVIEEVHVPDLGADKDVDLIDVMVNVGDTVEFEDGLITLETEKASMDVPAPFAGEILQLFVEAGAKVNSGDLIAKMVKTVVMESKVPTSVKKEAPVQKEEPKQTTTVQEVAATTASEATAVLTQKAKTVYASPSVRKVAREFGVDLGFVKGSGRKNRPS